MRSVAVLVFGSCVSVGLASCGTVPVTTRSYTTLNPWQSAQVVMSRGPLLIDIRGQPYAVAADVLATTVTEAMAEAVTWSATKSFTTNPDLAGSRAIRIVMTFNSPIPVGIYEQCIARPQGGDPAADGSIQVAVTLCAGTDPLSNVTGGLDRSSGISDQSFTTLIRQATRDLFLRREDTFSGPRDGAQQ